MSANSWSGRCEDVGGLLLSPTIKPSMCVGGPLHGQQRETDSKELAAIIGTPTSLAVTWNITPAIRGMCDDEAFRVIKTLYRPETVRISGPGMEFEARVWRWQLMPKDQVAIPALALLFASAMIGGKR